MNKIYLDNSDYLFYDDKDKQIKLHLGITNIDLNAEQELNDALEYTNKHITKIQYELISAQASHIRVLAKIEILSKFRKNLKEN